eukprot:TRINITY_DN8177_c0_g1_i2.p1 TRINITY_DN8177_c0_g1~~TRINITY_DN8177_c0_g1_i2.p1  ORF type:complete len:675 (-),score=130.00 TRINITY_DN8177_c0_g1_i2:81-2105(-)
MDEKKVPVLLKTNGSSGSVYTPKAPEQTEEPEELIHLSQEIEEGNVEYKLVLDPSPERFESLVSQLKWRLSEGQGEALYELGVEDNGFLRGLSTELLEQSKETLRRMAKEVNAEASLVCERSGKDGKVAEMLVRELRDDKYIDVRLAVCGNVDCGKSTLCGVLTRGKLDNGKGIMRANIFNHKHELETGRTSSISQQILGFNTKGECVNHKYTSSLHPPSWGDIIEQSYKIISFIDLAGHEKYLKTTESGMTGHIPDYVLLLVDGNMGATRMTKEHMGLALALKIPLIIVITKIDICPEKVLKQTLNDLTRILKMKCIRKAPLVIENDDELINAIKTINNERIVPIFQVSNVTGLRLDLLIKFLNMIPQRIQWKELKDKKPEVLIDQTYFVSGVGTVVSGTVMSGSIQSDQHLLLGPDDNGQFIPLQIKSLHSKRIPVRQVVAGQTAGFALRTINRSSVRKGMVLVSPELKPKAIWTFIAEVIILFHSTTIHPNYQPVVQCLTMRQSAKIVKIFSKESLKTGDRAEVMFRFLYFPEYLKVGMRIILREGRCKGIGIITKIDCEDTSDQKQGLNSDVDTSTEPQAQPQETNQENSNFEIPPQNDQIVATAENVEASTKSEINTSLIVVRESPSVDVSVNGAGDVLIMKSDQDQSNHFDAVLENQSDSNQRKTNNS